MSDLCDLAHLESVVVGKFGSTDGLFAWVMEYGAAHSWMRLSLHRGRHSRGIEVVCFLCYSFCGRFTGGPYRLKFVTERTEPDTLYEIADKDGSFSLRFSMVSIARVGPD